tara:strand:+ start:448 stop:696 length:249 start_codon:yes stop_codon:yes gene_type:complete
MQNTFIDDTMFPSFLMSLEKRPELTKLTFVKMVLTPNTVKTIFNLLELNNNIKELILVDCTFKPSFDKNTAQARDVDSYIFE